MLSFQRQLAVVLASAFVAAAAALLISVYVRHVRSGQLHRDQSFRYGEQLMIDEVYADLSGSVDTACRAALIDPLRSPTPLNMAKALAGCKYAEFLLDN